MLIIWKTLTSHESAFLPVLTLKLEDLRPFNICTKDWKSPHISIDVRNSFGLSGACGFRCEARYGSDRVSVVVWNPDSRSLSFDVFHNHEDALIRSVQTRLAV